MTDQYTYWRRGLAGHKQPAHEGDPQAGFYRMKEKGTVDSAVAYWSDSDGKEPMRCQINGKLVTPERAVDAWTYCCDKPVTHEAFQNRVRNGRWLNDTVVLDPTPAKTPAAGHNKPPADNSHEALVSVLDAIENEARKLLEAGPARTQDEADHASDIANELGALEKRVTDAHRVEKAPVLQEAKRIDGRWFALRDKANDLKTKLKLRVVTPFLSKLRRDAEEAAAAAIQAGVPAAEVPTEKVKAGSMRRSSALKVEKAARIEDYNAALMFFAPHQEVRELVQRLADRAVRAGISVPGTAVVETERAV